ncbi:hypothetical protein [Paraliomyxa miuraensis]|uniref:hypothetical protein n=1 Tax=Paraliomyxa miuraensis TaxID=376150 RepID=UPI002250778D|nr:hypothetical protein [Paraliomyxa miuraensis]MCX4242866.1 hypothetical protein [Paraliomyxa miuraensis]
MHGATAMLLGAALALLTSTAGWGSEPVPDHTPPPPTAENEAEIRACQDRCNAQGLDETDTATCRLNCRQSVQGRNENHIIRWTTEKPVGGTVPGQEAAPTVTTTTKVTPGGTTVQTTATTPKPAVAPPALPPKVEASPRQKYYFGLCDCQDRCNGNPDESARARCKLRCLRLQPGPPPPRAAAPPSQG